MNPLKIVGIVISVASWLTYVVTLPPIIDPLPEIAHPIRTSTWDQAETAYHKSLTGFARVLEPPKLTPITTIPLTNAFYIQSPRLRRTSEVSF